MKHSLFEFLGKDYPHALEEKYDRVLTRIEQLWGKPEIEDYFSDLIIDRRGGRRGFPKDALDEIILLRQLHRSETFRKADEREHALAELKRLGIPLTREEFLNAVNAGDQGLVDLFVQSSFNIHVLDDDGNSPLLIAIKNGYTVVATILIKAGVEVNEYDKMGETPLLLTCGKKTQGFKSIAERLITRGAYINERDRNGFTPLMLSISAGTDDISELLIEKGADVNAGTRKGITPLSLAMSSGNTPIAELLLSKGAKG
jgi:tankyrase